MKHSIDDTETTKYNKLIQKLTISFRETSTLATVLLQLIFTEHEITHTQ